MIGLLSELGVFVLICAVSVGINCVAGCNGVGDVAEFVVFVLLVTS